MLWGAYVEGVTTYGTTANPPFDMTGLDLFEAHAGKKVPIVHYGQTWWNSSHVYQPFYAGDHQKIRDRGSIPMQDWNSASIPLSDIYNGVHDTFLNTYATAVAAWGFPFFLRFNWEMNASYEPWADSHTPNSAGDYKLAWQHVHDIFTAHNATNVTWVWCCQVDYPGDTYETMASIYPGDTYVDWISLDGYNWGPNGVKNSDVWKSFATIYGQSYNTITGIAPSKPLMIGEFSCGETGGDKGAWITDALSVANLSNFPKIQALIWFNWNADGVPWPIESSTGATSAFAGSISSARFPANQFGDLTQSPIQPSTLIGGSVAILSCSGGGGNLQSMISNTAVAGDTINVADGIYNSIDCTKAITIQGTGSGFIIDAQGQTNVSAVRFHGTTCNGATLKNATVRGMGKNAPPASNQYAGVFCDAGAINLSVINCNIYAQSGSFSSPGDYAAYGVRSYQSTGLLVDTCTFSHLGVGVHVILDPTNVTITSTSIQGTITNCTFHDMDALANDSNGGNAVQVNGNIGTVNITNCTAYNMIAVSPQYVVDGGMFDFYGCGPVNIDNCLSYNNVNFIETGQSNDSSTSTKAAAHKDCGPLSVTNCLIRGNLSRRDSATGYYTPFTGTSAYAQTGITLRASTSVTIAGNTFDGVDYYCVIQDFSSAQFSGGVGPVSMHNNYYKGMTGGGSRLWKNLNTGAQTRSGYTQYTSGSNLTLGVGSAANVVDVPSGGIVMAVGSTDYNATQGTAFTTASQATGTPPFVTGTVTLPTNVGGPGGIVGTPTPPVVPPSGGGGLTDAQKLSNIKALHQAAQAAAASFYAAVDA